MAKVKSDKSVKAVKPNNDAEVKAMTSIKQGAVTKSSQTPKAKSQEMAKQVVVKADKAGKADKKSKKAVKEPTPEPSSDEGEDEEETSASSDSSESDEEVAKPAKVNGTTNGKSNGKVNGTSKVAAKAAAESSESSDSSGSDSDDAAAPVKSASAVTTKKAATTADSDESEDDDEVDSDADDSDESDSDEEPKTKGPIDASALSGALKRVASEEASDEDSEDSDASGIEESSSPSSDSADSSSLRSDESEDEAPPKKRKAESEATPVAKKAKKEDQTNGDGEGVKNLFVGSLSWNVDEDWLTREFESFGELSGVRVISDKATGRSKGFGYVEYVNAADAAKAHDEMKGKMIDNREINVDFAVPRSNDAGTGGYQNKANDRAKSYGDTPSEPSDTLFVGNISFEATEDIIGEEFGKHGSVIGVRLPTDPESGNPKGFGYVQFGSIEEAQVAFDNMKGAAICGRPIRLDFGRARASTGDSPRGGRGGGFSGGRGRGGDRGGRGGGRGRGGFGDRGGRGGSRGGRGGSTNRGGFGDFKGKKMTF
ncbi:hypothetical protein MMC19_003068 [Ptychographa xylographoides]|nr:hypothetical protein [Ptychographa xylographoides]